MWTTLQLRVKPFGVIYYKRNREWDIKRVNLKKKNMNQPYTDIRWTWQFWIRLILGKYRSSLLSDLLLYLSMICRNTENTSTSWNLYVRVIQNLLQLERNKWNGNVKNAERLTITIITSKTRRYPWGIQRRVSTHRGGVTPDQFKSQVPRSVQIFISGGGLVGVGWYSIPTQIRSAKICPNFHFWGRVGGSGWWVVVVVGGGRCGAVMIEGGSQTQIPNAKICADFHLGGGSCRLRVWRLIIENIQSQHKRAATVCTECIRVPRNLP